MSASRKPSAAGRRAPASVPDRAGSVEPEDEHGESTEAEAGSTGGSSGTDGTSAAGFSQSLERGLAILSAFAESGAVLGIADLARAVGLSRSSAHRYVSTLAKLGYVQQDPDTRKYSLGPRVIDLGFAALSSMEMTRVAARHLQSLSDETGFAASMAVLDGPDIVYVDRRRSRRPNGLVVDLNLHVGSRLPAYCTSMGKVLLAHREPAALRVLLDRTNLARRGPNTITAREQLMSVLAKVRRSGIAVNDEELAPGLRSVAAPVRDRSGAVVAAINVAVHLTTWSASVDSLTGRIEEPLRRTAAEISTRLGYRPQAPTT
ncbi:helix-turn-helix domain-containing protein [Actinomadura sp. LD22]|uniref:Glycerol operon regulatory protein n=1 Tax=Actinomadura physcomitrii TaxID=2650748 RepID=A0A6I4MSW7_9ACTN|nr:IclR family transcriptional regulator [Actinomadura physcomitrii]MWA05386.1 helix-turn-helix domain-containing protein [Actinomadura physcomitrii]